MEHLVRKYGFSVSGDGLLVKLNVHSVCICTIRTRSASFLDTISLGSNGYKPKCETYRKPQGSINVLITHNMSNLPSILEFFLGFF